MVRLPVRRVMDSAEQAYLYIAKLESALKRY